MRKFLGLAIYIPVAIVLIAIAVATRGWVPLSIDPFNAQNPSLTVEAPLFVLLFLTLIIGMFLGSIATWLRQAPYRKMARQYRSDHVAPVDATGKAVARPRA
jgi:uncharacterized integral membrane protein